MPLVDASGAEIGEVLTGGATVRFTVCVDPHQGSPGAISGLFAAFSDAALAGLVRELIDPREKRPDIHVFRPAKGSYALDIGRDFDERAEIYLRIDTRGLTSYETVIQVRLAALMTQRLHQHDLYGMFNVVVEVNGSTKLRFPRTTDGQQEGCQR